MAAETKIKLEMESPLSPVRVRDWVLFYVTNHQHIFYCDHALQFISFIFVPSFTEGFSSDLCIHGLFETSLAFALMMMTSLLIGISL